MNIRNSKAFLKWQIYFYFSTIHNYLIWHIIKNYIGFLSRDFREAYTILEKAQVGVSGGEEEWRECITATEIALGDAIGAIFIRRAFSGEAKDMVVYIITSLSLY